MTQSFPHWLRDQVGRGDEVGDFAERASELTDLPEHGDKAIFDGYFETSLQGDRRHYERAWSEFEASPGGGSTAP